eukprot:CAMPEP_0116003654 /NCGR_PEP_ID=MMETSP0321-20121206/169_1 /TAXON_ID=163516 /ORGANISM="Leptocylindrus danicus var. danicus, Strain B650" /LENGTH=358 /DNA_ID=CAMNT_0003471873 /DNA_START=46 /DNA_END=1122 /DNA_ORIENTATION=+
MEDFELCISLDSNGRTNFNASCSTPATNEEEQPPRTFWIPSNGAPRCALERMALDVFQHHVPEDSPASQRIDSSTSGAEWWVQVRPSTPKSGRYAMLVGDNDADDVMAGISFHWDKDEELRIHTGMFIHPHISTVTYLTDIGAPTLVIDKRVDYVTGAPIADNAEAGGGAASVVITHNGFCSWPKSGKHLSFDGRFLHAAPSDFMEEGIFEKQCQVPDGTKDADLKSVQRYHRRITFLVNVWINHRPIGVNPFPETMLDKLSKCDLNEESIFRDCRPCEEIEESVIDDAKDGQKFTWPVGGCSSTDNLKLYAPLTTIRNQMKTGGNISMKWEATNGGLLSIGSTDDESIEGNKRQKHA